MNQSVSFKEAGPTNSKASGTTSSWNRRMSIRGFLVSRVLLPILYGKRDAGLDAFDKAIAANRLAGPAQPNEKIKSKYRVRDETLNGNRQFKVAPKAGAESLLRVLYLHGGAYVFDLGAIQWPLVTQLVDELGCEVCIPIYPLAPQANVEAGLAAAVDAYEELVAEVGAQNVVVTGDSAGGGLALALCHSIRNAGGAPPRAAVLFYPWLDVSISGADQVELANKDKLLTVETLRHAGRLWAGNRNVRDPKVSPLFGKHHGLPPTLVLVGTNDVLLSDARRFSSVCPEAVIHEYPGMFHGFVCAPIPEMRHAIAQVVRFVK